MTKPKPKHAQTEAGVTNWTWRRNLPPTTQHRKSKTNTKRTKNSKIDIRPKMFPATLKQIRILPSQVIPPHFLFFFITEVNATNWAWGRDLPLQQHRKPKTKTKRAKRSKIYIRPKSSPTKIKDARMLRSQVILSRLLFVFVLFSSPTTMGNNQPQ